MLQGRELKEAVTDYIDNYSVEAGLEATTVRHKAELLKKLVIFLHDKPYDLDSARAFISYLRQHGWKEPNSILNIVRILRAFTNYLARRKYIKESFAQDLIKPKIPKKDFNYVSPEVVEKIIEAGVEIGKGDRKRSIFYKNEARLALNFVLRTGLRIQETIELKGSDLNIYDNPPYFWVNSKGGDREMLPLPQDMVDILKTRVDNNRLFAISNKLCNQVLERGCKKLNIEPKLTNHSLRHIFASNLVKNKVPIQMVSRLMRHSSVDITDKTYSHLDLTDLALIINGLQTVVRKGLKTNEVYDLIIASVKNTGVDRDRRFKLVTTVDVKGLTIKLTETEGIIK